jgi:hypothetical protein
MTKVRGILPESSDSGYCAITLYIDDVHDMHPAFDDEADRLALGCGVGDVCVAYKALLHFQVIGLHRSIARKIPDEILKRL